MAQNTASPIHQKRAPLLPRGKSRRVPIDCVGCWGKKERPSDLFCKKCRKGFRAAKRRDQELDEMLERAIQSEA